MVFSAALVSIYHVTNLTDAFAQESDNKRMFIVNVNLVGGLNSETNNICFDTVDVYVEEYPQYGYFGIDLDDARYSDSDDGDYSTKIVMSYGLIDIYEVVHIGMEEVSSDEISNDKHCYSLKNMPQRAVESIKIVV